MKKTNLFLCIFIIFCSSTIYSQSEIGSFLGVKLGQSYSEVKSVIQNSYSPNSITGTEYRTPNIEYSDSTIQILFCKVKFLNHEWPNVKFTFKDNKLVEGYFYDFETHDQRPTETTENNYITQVYNNYFNEVVSSLTLKYSKPAITNPFNYIWIDSNRNSITFRIEFENEHWHHPADNHIEIINKARISIIYKSSTSLDNY